MFVKNPEDCDTKQHGSRLRDIVSMCTRGKVCNYVAGRNKRSAKPSIIYEDNQGAIFLDNNRQVYICTKHIDVRHRFLRDMAERKDIDIQYIQSEEKPADIVTKNTSEADLARHMKSIA